MATHRLNITGGLLPDTTGEAFYEPYSVLATNDQWRHLVIRLGASNSAEPTVKHGLYGKFSVPQNYASNPRIIIHWTSTLTTGNVVFDFDYRAVGGNDAESLDQVGTQQAATVTDAAPSAANNQLEAALSLSAGNFTAGDTVEFFVGRDGVNVSDTLAGSAIVHSIEFEYTD